VERELVVTLPERPAGWNPLYARSWSEWVVKDLFLAGLWHLDQQLVPHPELAIELPTRSNGGISSDGRTLTIYLRSDLTWSDGEPITAQDVVFTYEMAIEPGNHAATRFPYSAVDEIVAVDDRTIRVVFSEPFGPWPATLFPYILPRHVLEPVFEQVGSLDRTATDWWPWAVSGPFVPVGEDEGGFVLAANPSYWRGGPGIDRVRLQVAPDAGDRLAAVSEGRESLAPFLWPEPVPEAHLPAGGEIHLAPSGLVETLFFNLDPGTGHPALREAAVRQAVAGAVDRRAVCALLTPGQAAPAVGLWDETRYAGQASRGPAVQEASVEEALDRAGWRDGDGDGVREREGVRLSFRYAVPGAGVNRAAAQAAVADMLRRAGIEVHLVEWGDPVGWDLGQWAEAPPGYPDPDDPRWLCAEAGVGGMNRSHVCDEDLDRLIYTQAGVSDLSERAGLIYQIEALNRQQGWWVPLCRLFDVWVAGGASDRLRLWRGGPFWNAWAW
jgi:peptide/nickel transport system substrate-binding protein